MDRKQTSRAASLSKTEPIVRRPRSRATSLPTPADRLLQLQRVAGNRAVRLWLQRPTIQARLRIGEPGDRYEQEADRVAETVVRMPEPQPRSPASSSGRPAVPIQRLCPECEQETHRKSEGEEEEEVVREQPLDLQAAAAGEDEEEEVQPSLIQRQADQEEGEVQPRLLQRQAEEEEEQEVRRQVAEEEEEPVRARPAEGMAPAVPSGFKAGLDSARGEGRPLPEPARAFFEPRFGRDFGQVRIHTGARSGELAGSIRAEAFTQGSDVFFGAGRFAPDSSSGKQLLAHELTHVVQQGGSAATSRPTAPAVRRQPVAETPQPAEPPAPAAEVGQTSTTLLVEDNSAELGAGQMRKGEFLAEVRPQVIAAAEEVLATAGRTTRECPYLRLVFFFLARRDAGYIDRTLRGFAPELTRATTARAYIPPVVARVREATERWVATGKITSLPAGLPGSLPLSTAAGAASGGGQDAGVEIQRKSAAGGVPSAAGPGAIRARLGPGRPLDGGVRARMESAFGADLSGVRAHTGATAASLSRSLAARAFTVGEHVAFGSGEYQPGTPIGDALIAHELAHVMQQGANRGSVMAKGSAGYAALEDDADRSAVGAVAALWGGARENLADISHTLMPRLKSGLRLQRCSAKKTRLQDYKDKKPEHDPSKLSKSAIEATNQYKAYMKPSSIWQRQLKVTRVEALLACQLILRSLRAGKSFSWATQAREFIIKARKQLGAAKKAEALTGKLEWVKSQESEFKSPTTAKSAFAKWILAGGPVPTDTSKMNCWEAILFAAYQGKFIGKAWIEKVYKAAAAKSGYAIPGEVEKNLCGGKKYTFDPRDPSSPKPLPGDIVIFKAAYKHVAISLGTKAGKQQVISHWTPPSIFNKTVKKTTIEALLPHAGVTKVKFCTAPW